MRAFSLKSTVVSVATTFSIALGAVLIPASMGFASKSYAQSEASVVLSMLPVASVVVTGVGASTAAGASVAAPVILSAAGAVFVVKLVEVTARGTVYVLGKGVKASAVGVGASVTVSVIGTGMVLSALGEAIAFIPNELGKALLHNERITY
jgi:hypothetical protein